MLATHSDHHSCDQSNTDKTTPYGERAEKNFQKKNSIEFPF